ncbi:hypothetical protein BACCELL_02231 [Bacteroides cellulosilyticus DSM 14838]|uniref:Uncharacterized protein n=1 Tax=Bacteroides cellulosilyticus DSM 14838 TaxID=537012 RepID=E2ND72_9BACE|nr:hypothetical protein BACCELL_02231 [Bacteroides cellulosilyticus DSM 14838]
MKERKSCKSVSFVSQNLSPPEKSCKTCNFFNYNNIYLPPYKAKL